MKALYITNLGLLDNLGQTQILPYLEGLSKKGISVHVLSFEKMRNLCNRPYVEDAEKRLKGMGIEWKRLLYHRRWGNLWDVLTGSLKALKITITEGISILHARATIPVLIAWPIAKILRRKIIYDRRGTMAGDFVDDVNKENIFSIRAFSFMVNAIDRFIMRHSDAIIVLSERALGMLKGDRYIRAGEKIVEAIPCCADISKFRDNSPKEFESELNGRFVVSYVGSLGTCYLLKEMAEFFKVFKKKKQDALFLIISHTDKNFIENTLKKQGLLPEDDYIIKNLKPDEVPGYLKSCKFSIMFIKDVDCKIGSSPTKFAESLAAGIPVIVNRGIGDTENIIRMQKIGVMPRSLDPASYEDAAGNILSLLDEGGTLEQRCIETANKYFSLELGIERYKDIYAGLKHDI